MSSPIKNVLITGGAGYVGHVLTPRLLAAGYNVTVYDILFFGCRLPNSPNLRVIQGDIRDTAKLAKAFEGQDAVLHLACISNDASFELDENLSKSINYDCFEPMVAAAKKAGVKRFVYCSSSSVYGVSDSPNVTEEHPLIPLTLYNKFKGMCEPILWKHMADAYRLMLKAPHEKIHGETFNIGFQNHSIADLAKTVKAVVSGQFPGRKEIEIVTTPSNDNRSYHVNSDKIRRVLGFAPKRTIEDAIRDVARAFQNHLLPASFDEDGYYNVRTMKKLGAK
jgi:nucleoside-diphosphate-sugar epimerase